MNKFVGYVAAGVAAVTFAGAAFAAPVASPVVSLDSCELSDTLANADNCWGSTETNANDSASLFNSGTMVDVAKWMDGTIGGGSGLFGYNDWSQLAKAESENSWSNGGLEVSFGDAVDPYDGSWEWTGPIYDQMVLVLKQGNTFAAYLFNGGLPTSGFWDATVANFRDNANGLSHMSVYGRGGISEIPLPAAGFLLLGGLASLAAARRRKA